LKEFTIRTISGITYAGLMVAAVMIHPLIFAAVYLLVLVIGMNEFYSLIPEGENRAMKIPGIITGILLFLSVFLIYYQGAPELILGIPVIALLTIMALPMFRPNAHALHSLGLTLAGILYVALPISSFNGLVFNPYQAGFDYQVALFLFAVIWLNDTGAYITGMFLGRHKMFPRISPKKSWEGLIGGLVIAMLAAWLIQPILPGIPQSMIWIMTPAAVIAGTFGDLAESTWKRAAGVKDSGKIMPGHGGILDRFDSMLFAAPVVYLLIRLIQ
jgi:phosphatidate cytidylyltransferase